MTALSVDEGQDVIEMKSSVYKNREMPPVKFQHKRHAKDLNIACNECHHVYGDFRPSDGTGTNVETLAKSLQKQGIELRVYSHRNFWKKGDKVEKCQVCHSEPKSPEGDRKKLRPPERIRKYHFDAIHAQCTGCHKFLSRRRQVAGPTRKCDKCHMVHKGGLHIR